MKKLFNFLSALIVLLALGSCSDNAMTEEPQAPSESTELTPKIKRAIDLANAEMERYYPAKSRAEARKPAMDAIGTICEATSRSGEDTLIYVVNYADNGGYALVSARDNVDPVLAVVPEGNYNPEEGSDNPGFNLFLGAAKEHVKAAVEEAVITPNPGNQYIIENGKYVRYENDITHWGGKARMGETHHWDQRSIYGDLCPNGTTGCGPLAMASIITYLRYQDLKIDRMHYTYPGHDIEYEDIDWEQVYKHKHLSYYDNSWTYHGRVCYERDTALTHTTIARFCRQLGHDAKANYKHGSESKGPSTGIDRKTPINVFKKYMPEFDVSNLLDFKSYTTMRCIDHGLLYMRGDVKGEDSGHAWVCDGYDYYKTVTTRYESDIPEVVTYPIQYNWQYAGTYVSESSKNYMIWGWGGADDGWYSGDVLETSSCSLYKFQYISVTKGL